MSLQFRRPQSAIQHFLMSKPFLGESFRERLFQDSADYRRYVARKLTNQRSIVAMHLVQPAVLRRIGPLSCVEVGSRDSACVFLWSRPLHVFLAAPLRSCQVSVSRCDRLTQQPASHLTRCARTVEERGRVYSPPLMVQAGEVRPDHGEQDMPPNQTE